MPWAWHLLSGEGFVLLLFVLSPGFHVSCHKSKGLQHQVLLVLRVVG